MWPFPRKSKAQLLDEEITAAVRLAAEHWLEFHESGAVPDNLGLRIQLGQFAKPFRPIMERHFSSLEAAPSELVLLILAEGVAASGTHSRSAIERELGITLPDVPILQR